VVCFVLFFLAAGQISAKVGGFLARERRLWGRRARSVRRSVLGATRVLSRGLGVAAPCSFFFIFSDPGGIGGGTERSLGQTGGEHPGTPGTTKAPQEHPKPPGKNAAARLRGGGISALLL